MSEKPMSKVCLTPKQQKFFNYFVNYQKENGMLPTPSQATRDLRADGVKCSGGSIYQMYGALFLKGAFTGGSSLTQGYRKLHGVANTAVDVKALKFQPKAKPAPARAAPAGKLDDLIQQEIAKYFANLMRGGQSLTLNE
jgi:hypothetical protein